MSTDPFEALENYFTNRSDELDWLCNLNRKLWARNGDVFLGGTIGLGIPGEPILFIDNQYRIITVLFPPQFDITDSAIDALCLLRYQDFILAGLKFTTGPSYDLHLWIYESQHDRMMKMRKMFGLRHMFPRLKHLSHGFLSLRIHYSIINDDWNDLGGSKTTPIQAS